VYDPTIGRFLSADPIIQTFALSQAINPFSYVMNMPLALIDPSGYSWLSRLFHWIGHHIGQIVLAVLSVVTCGLVGLLAAVLLPEKDARILASIGLAIAMPAIGFTGFWGTVATGAAAGGVASGNLHGAVLSAITAGLLYGAGALASKVAHAVSTPINTTAQATDNSVAAGAAFPPAAEADTIIASSMPSISAPSEQQPRPPAESFTSPMPWQPRSQMHVHREVRNERSNRQVVDPAWMISIWSFSPFDLSIHAS